MKCVDGEDATNGRAKWSVDVEDATNGRAKWSVDGKMLPMAVPNEV